MHITAHSAGPVMGMLATMRALTGFIDFLFASPGPDGYYDCGGLDSILMAGSDTESSTGRRPNALVTGNALLNSDEAA